MTSPFPKSWLMDFLWRHRIRLLGAVAGLTIINVAWVALSYLVYPGYLDHGEPSVALISLRLLDGVPAYPAFDDPGRVTNLYGPMTFITYALSFAVLGPSVAAGKAASVAVAVLIPVAAFFANRRHGTAWGITGSVLAGAFVLWNVPMSIWNRPDGFIVLLGILAVWLMNAARPGKPEWGKSIAISVCAGLAVGFKIHAGIYFAPALLYHCLNEGRGLRVFTVMCLAVAVVVLIPFTLPVFPLANYLSWFGPMAGKDSPLVLVIKVLRYALIYAAPLLLFSASVKWAKDKTSRAEAVYAGTYVVGMALAVYLGSKPGAGHYYLFPFLGLTIDLITRHGRRIPGHAGIVLGGVAAVAVIVFALGIPVQKRFQRALHWQQGERITAEIQNIMTRYPDNTIEMGIGQDLKTYPVTFFKSLLVLAGHPYTLDAAIMTETSMLKIPLTDDTLAMIRGCNTDIWLIPRDEKPFTMEGYYNNPIVRPEFIEAFRGSYAKRETFEFFDVWACSRPL